MGRREKQLEELALASMISAVITVIILAFGDGNYSRFKAVIGGLMMFFVLMQSIYNLMELFIRTKGEPRP